MTCLTTMAEIQQEEFDQVNAEGERVDQQPLLATD
jgi:hypothetical protein